TAGMAIGTEIAPSHPALIRTVRMRAERLRGVDLARSASRGDHAGWRGAGSLRARHDSLCTGRAVGLVGEACKWLGLLGALTPRRDGLGWHSLGRRASAGPGRVQHDKQPQESQDHQLVVKLVWNHGKAPSQWCDTEALYLVFGARQLSAGYRYTTHYALLDCFSSSYKGLTSTLLHAYIFSCYYVCINLCRHRSMFLCTQLW